MRLYLLLVLYSFCLGYTIYLQSMEKFVTFLETAKHIQKLLENKAIKELEHIAAELRKLGFLFNVYKNPTPVGVAIIPLVNDNGFIGKYLGLVRNIAPCVGGEAFGGGFVDEGETIEQALTRECKEEFNISIDVESWTLVCSKITPTNNVLIFGKTAGLHVDRVDWEFTNSEVQKVVMLDKTSKLCFPLHQEILDSLYP